MNKSADLKKVAFFLVTSYFAIFTLLVGDTRFEALAAQYSSIFFTTVLIRVLTVSLILSLILELEYSQF